MDERKEAPKRWKRQKAVVGAAAPDAVAGAAAAVPGGPASWSVVGGVASEPTADSSGSSQSKSKRTCVRSLSRGWCASIASASPHVPSRNTKRRSDVRVQAAGTEGD